MLKQLDEDEAVGHSAPLIAARDWPVSASSSKSRFAVDGDDFAATAERSSCMHDSRIIYHDNIAVLPLE